MSIETLSDLSSMCHSRAVLPSWNIIVALNEFKGMYVKMITQILET